MGNKKSKPKSGYHRPPKWYLKSLARDRKLARDDPIFDEQATLLNFANHLSQEEVTLFLTDHPGFLQNFALDNVSDHRLKQWMRSTVADSEEFENIIASNVDKDEGDSPIYVEGPRRLQQLKALAQAMIIPSKPYDEDVDSLREALPDIRKKHIPDIESHAFSTSKVEEGLSNAIVYRMFEDILGNDIFPTEKFIHFLAAVSSNYGIKALCNYNHALCHFQSMYWILRTHADLFTKTELKAILLASISHDIRDAGVSSENVISWVFARLPLSRPLIVKHRCNIFLALLLIEENNILENLELCEFEEIIAIVMECIEYTDFSRYISYMSDFEVCMTEDFDITKRQGKKTAIKLLMVLCDMSGYWKPFEEHFVVTEEIYKWFLKFAVEHQATKVPMGKDITMEVLKENSRFQIYMMRNLAIPLFDIGEFVFSCLRPAVVEAKKNLKRWCDEKET